MTDEIRQCIRCHSKCLLKEFKVNRIGLLGKTCERCRKQAKKKYYEEHKEHINATNKKYYEEHKEQIKEQGKVYREQNKEIIVERKKQFAEAHKKEISAYHKQWSKSTMDIIAMVKIKAYKQKDARHKLTYDDKDYIDIEWIKDRLIKCDNKCEICGCLVKITQYDSYDKKQYSVDRIDNKLAHVKTNCQIVCWDCNNHKQ